MKEARGREIVERPTVTKRDLERRNEMSEMMGEKRQERPTGILIHAYSQCSDGGEHTRGQPGAKAKSERMNPSHADGPSASGGHGTHHNSREGAWPVVSQISRCLDR